MLHTLNKAWVNILISQIERGDIDNALLVCFDSQEKGYYQEMLSRNLSDSERIECVSVGFLKEVMKARADGKVYGDILVSSRVHDQSVFDYLSKHNARLLKQN